MRPPLLPYSLLISVTVLCSTVASTVSTTGTVSCLTVVLLNSIGAYARLPESRFTAKTSAEPKEHLYAEHRRYKRQFGEEEPNSPQLDLNITVPYIFSARLYPYGTTKGDLLIHGDQEAYRLENPFHFLEQVYDTIYIRSDGAVSLSPKLLPPAALPVTEPTIAVFWQKSTGGNVYYRETNDPNIVNLAHNEVNIQYRYGSQFHVRSVVVVTWEDVKDESSPSADGNVFQLALMIGDTMTFAHIVYSKLNSHLDAVAGFSGVNASYSLPDSATNEAIQLSEKSDIGIPGEWLFRIDADQTYLCGAGFKGIECIESCANSQWYNDCSKSCHCDGGDACDQESGRCPNAKCSPGWTGAPVCDQDVDECAEAATTCPNEQPDCLNTPGAYLCLCFEYDEENKMCKGSAKPQKSELIPVGVVPLNPSIGGLHQTTAKPAVVRNRFASTVAPAQFAKIAAPMGQPTKIPTPINIDNLPVTEIRKEVPSTPVMSTSAPSTTEPPAECPPCDVNAFCEHKTATCTCREGWIGNGESCTDIDECSVGETCSSHAFCVNTPGSYDCTCERGYRFEGNNCNDINECLEGNPCGTSDGVRCRNNFGSYECICADGYAGDPHRGCHDVDECSLDSCGPNAKCSNTPGGFECECLDGFERLSDNSSCSDINECDLEPCHARALCSNLIGTFSCRCADGFVGDGLECHETILYPIANDSIVIPRSMDSLATIDLASPLTIFGKKYSTVYVSSNGVLSFDRPLPGLLEKAESLREPAIFALHAHYDYVREGLVAYTYVNESDSAALNVLNRASVSVQTSFRLPTFRTKHLHIFTFDRLRQAGSENYNSFQALIADSEAATMLILIYEQTDSRGPITGISTKSVFHYLPNDMLATHSNVGQPGKWILRIDEDLVSCPAGTTGPPVCNQNCPIGKFGFGCASECHCFGGLACDYVTGLCVNGRCDAGWTGANCDQDIDECNQGIVQCGEFADCINSRGSFECKCKKGFIGDGKTCKAVERCFSRFGRYCHENATCEEIIRGEPECVCFRGYRGDGFQCQQILVTTPIPLLDLRNHTITNAITNNTSIVPQPIDEDSVEDISKGIQKPHGIEDVSEVREHSHGRDEEEHPFVMTNWVTEEKQPDATARRRPVSVTPPPSPPREVHRDDDRNSIVDDFQVGAKDVQVADSGSMLLFVLPTVFCAIWLIVVLVIVALCWNQKKKPATGACTKQHLESAYR